MQELNVIWERLTGRASVGAWDAVFKVASKTHKQTHTSYYSVRKNPAQMSYKKRLKENEQEDCLFLEASEIGYQ